MSTFTNISPPPPGSDANQYLYNILNIYHILRRKYMFMYREFNLHIFVKTLNDVQVQALYILFKLSTCHSNI